VVELTEGSNLLQMFDFTAVYYDHAEVFKQFSAKELQSIVLLAAVQCGLRATYAGPPTDPAIKWLVTTIGCDIKLS
jgi:hypothetical protein